jgi:methionyl-tRNA formyltransferase
VHASLLPEYRGAAPVHRAVIKGERETGVTIMRMTPSLDAGPMLGVLKRAIGPDETSVDVERGLSLAGAILLVDVVEQIATGMEWGEPQDEARATYAPRLTKEEGLIDWRLGARQIHDRVRGLHPWPHAYTYLDGVRVIVLKTHAALEPGIVAEPGTVVSPPGGTLVIATGDGLLAIDELQLEGRRPVRARDFLAGRTLPPGTRFSSDPGRRP